MTLEAQCHSCIPSKLCRRWKRGGRGEGRATHSSRSWVSPAADGRLSRAPLVLLVSREASPAPAARWLGRGPSNVTLLLHTVDLPRPSAAFFQSVAQRRTTRWRLWAACNQPLVRSCCAYPLPTEGWGTPAHLHLLLGVQLLPECLHARCKAQEARDALPEELLVVGLHCPLLPRLLSPHLQHEAQPCSPHLQGEEEVRPSPPAQAPSTGARSTPGTGSPLPSPVVRRPRTTGPAPCPAAPASCPPATGQKGNVSLGRPP